jgi:tetratricopeptide (TPR) repeat protein
MRNNNFNGTRACFCLAVWLGAFSIFARDEQGLKKLAWFELSLPGLSLAQLTLEPARKDLSKMNLEWVSSEELMDKLVAIDREQSRLQMADLWIDRGRKHLLALKLAKAEREFRKAVEVQEAGFVRFHDPQSLANALLQLGVTQYQSEDRGAAGHTFSRVLALAPDLQLSKRYYSPSIRRAFAKAQQEISRIETLVPAPEEMLRICQALGLAGVVVVSQERLGEQPLLRLSLFSLKRRSYIAVETAVLKESDSGRIGRDLAHRMTPSVAAVAGIPTTGQKPTPPFTAGTSALVDQADKQQAVSPWYKRHWWIWPAAAAIVAAVALPLTVFREDVVDVRVH